MAQANWEADKMLDVYIYDYLVKRKLHASAKAFQVEGKVSTDPVAINAPGGFLFEWWSVFWDIFIARTNDKHSEVDGHLPGPTLHGAPAGISGNTQPLPNHNQQPPLSAQDVKSEMSYIMSPRAVGREGSLIGSQGSSQGGNSLTLKGWPLTGLDHLRYGLLQPKSLMQSPQSFNQLQLQQQLMLQAQQNLTPPSSNDLESRRLRMLLNNPNVGSSMQQQYMQHPLSSQQSRNSNPHHQPQYKLTSSGGMTGDGSMSNAYRGND